MSLLLEYTLIYFAVLLLVALGACFSEHSGIINLGLEGIMVVGALGGAMTMNLLPKETGAAAMVLMVVFVSALAGLLYSLLLAVAAIRFKADQILVGTALNLLGIAAATVMVKAFNMSHLASNISSELVYIEQKKALSLPFFDGLNWFVVIAVIALVASAVILYHTSFGLRLRACGEHPLAADNVGINVTEMRYLGVLISGVLGGLGGIACITAGVSSWKFEQGVAGFGFLALTVLIFGQWRPKYIALAALLFGFFRALSNVYSGFDFLNSLHIPGPFYNMQPYIISLLVLAFVSRKSRAPKAEGQPYDKEKR